MKAKIACLQLAASQDFERNLNQALQLARAALRRGADILAFPEMFLFRGCPSRYGEMVEKTKGALRQFQRLARRSRVPILLGSILEKSSRPGRYFNTSLFISESGHLAAKYRKIHLFDVTTPGKLNVKESRYFLPGRSIRTVSWRGIRFGFTICYDLRFPELFRRLAGRGAEVIFAPSNFLRETGKAHWHVLIRARAIENQAYLVAPAQVGVHPALRRRSFGYSLIVDPWGKIVAEGTSGGTEVVLAEVDTNFSRNLRREFPVFKRFF